MFSGTWEVAQTAENIPAQKFWRKVVLEYSGGLFEEITRTDWNGFIQRFVNAK